MFLSYRVLIMTETLWLSSEMNVKHCYPASHNQVEISRHLGEITTGIFFFFFFFLPRQSVLHEAPHEYKFSQHEDE